MSTQMKTNGFLLFFPHLSGIDILLQPLFKQIQNQTVLTLEQRLSVSVLLFTSNTLFPPSIFFLVPSENDGIITSFQPHLLPATLAHR